VIALMTHAINLKNVRLMAGMIAVALLGATAAFLSPALSLGILALAILLILAFITPAAGLVSLLIFAPLKALIAAETHYPLPLDIGQLVLIGLFAIWLLNGIAHRENIYLLVSNVQMPLLVFTAAAALTLPSAVVPQLAISELLKWIEMLALISLCMALFTKRDIEWLLFTIVLAGSMQAAVGLYEFLGGSGAEHLRILDDRFFRAFGTFGQPNPFGAFMGITLPIALTGILRKLQALWHEGGRRSIQLWKDQTQRTELIWLAFYGIASGLLFAGLLASWSRGAWMGFGAAAVIMLVFLPRSMQGKAAIFVAVIVFGGIVWGAGLLPDALTARMSSFVGELTTITDVRGVDITDSNYAVTERIAHWQAAVRMAEDHPWLGVGFGNYEAAYPQYQLMNWPQALGHAHNYYLNLLAETGILGLAAYGAAWLSIVIMTLRLLHRSSGSDRLLAVGLLGVWSYLTVHHAVDKLYVNNMFLHIACMLGILAILYEDA
jgi:putative inorganic carbon (HCO3(-)) transporter